MSKKINFKIVTPERTLFEQEVDQITLPVTDGEVTIMPDHRSYIASLKAGEVMFKVGGKETLLVVSSGFVEFNNNTLVVLADTAEAADEIDLKRAEEARKRAEEIKKEKVTMNEMEYARVAAAIEKESARVRVARKHHSRHNIKID
ncbi:MAG: ATP synthase epsilon chain [Candidatus Uhrbacteria bacterium GW2011_GWD2_41_121]|nr:MAG: F0F1-type ATP synthase subunit epsilon, F-type H+-transporting ATPase subunit epsilon [Parcubacteria group bacterium GW2011_GWC1_36_108]KKQ30111.1 MAG: ATP synthase epsilon chain [Candidatus Moranbacteria bacterium GW2011_GWE1_37_24]KKQ39520.1 MAG: ATP synthase epsilon chain [Candidatus Moranbacteria bacterium GW2011_GWC2_37_73]KKR89439.1 MAG: ATP synthase epsilon chain [Candidatus Uhrbacteria bacterium GW2011_GWD2_41_121]HBU10381.1 F0F1 ATP synthase subunit epsilon [Candidatus Moranbac